MYKICRDENRILSLEKCQFSQLGISEREHLQEWIAKTPSCLDEDLLIIQKEFAGFSDTRERLDLLALDKQGCLVVIENKLDDSGKDVTWQALKYASYCSTLSREGICSIYQQYLNDTGNDKDAEQELIEFLEIDNLTDMALNSGISQRIILVAANFRKEVTATVMWLLNFNIRLQCFKTIPYSMDGQLFLNIEQVIPTPDVTEFTIGLAQKAQEGVRDIRHVKDYAMACREFWLALLPVMNEKSDLFKNISARPKTWITAHRNGTFVFAATKTYARAEFYIDQGDQSENERIFDALFDRKEEIEIAFGNKLVWERLEGKRACRIKAEQCGTITDPELWPGMIEFMTDAMTALEKAIRGPFAEIV